MFSLPCHSSRLPNIYHWWIESITVFLCLKLTVSLFSVFLRLKLTALHSHRHCLLFSLWPTTSNAVSTIIKWTVGWSRRYLPSQQINCWLEQEVLTIPANKPHSPMTNMMLKTAEPTTEPTPMSSCREIELNLFTRCQHWILIVSFTRCQQNAKLSKTFTRWQHHRTTFRTCTVAFTGSYVTNSLPTFFH